MAAAVVVSACGGSPTVPSPPPPPPPVVNNTPPTISGIRASAQRVDADKEIEVTAVVQDAETALDQLTYAWSATPTGGTFTGSGPVVKWRAPKGQRTPDMYTLTLTVTENYTSAGLPQQNRVSSSTSVRYNDSIAEVTALAVQFYNDFGTYDVSAAQCVRNFSDSCGKDKEEETAQIQANRDRRDYRIVGSTLSSAANLTFDNAMTGATFVQSCTFEDVSTVNGKRTRVTGDCFLTAVYEDWRWWLCVSRFLNGSSTELNLKHRVPGRVIQLYP